jgi:hypothetical protein
MLLSSYPYAVDRSANDATIKKAYKKLSKKYHPDKNDTPEAKDKFVDVARGGFICAASTSKPPLINCLQRTRSCRIPRLEYPLVLKIRLSNMA